MVASLEWKNANLSRAFPFSASTAGNPDALPSTYLTNGYVLFDCSAAESTSTISSAFIHTISTTHEGAVLGLTLELASADGTGTRAIVFDDLLFIAFAAEFGAVIKFMDVDSTTGTVISGGFTVGDAKAVYTYPATKELTAEAGLLDDCILHDISGLYVSAIRVGDNYLTGDVELVAGEGIEFEADTAEGRLVISNTRYSVPDENLKITNDDELLERLTSTLGSPISSINGVKPDADGNISIVGSREISISGGTIVQGGTDNATVISTDAIAVSSVGVGTITIGLVKDPCMDDAAIEDLAANAQNLSERCAMIDAAQKALDNGVNSLATQLTRVS